MAAKHSSMRKAVFFELHQLPFRAVNARAQGCNGGHGRTPFRATHSDHRYLSFLKSFKHSDFGKSANTSWAEKHTHRQNNMGQRVVGFSLRCGFWGCGAASF